MHCILDTLFWSNVSQYWTFVSILFGYRTFVSQYMYTGESTLSADLTSANFIICRCQTPDAPNPSDALLWLGSVDFLRPACRGCRRSCLRRPQKTYTPELSSGQVQRVGIGHNPWVSKATECRTCKSSRNGTPWILRDHCISIVLFYF